jgi:hypothetical protein
VIATDFHAEVLLAQTQLPWIREACDAGILDFCILEVSSASPTELGHRKLLHSGIVSFQHMQLGRTVFIRRRQARERSPRGFVCCDGKLCI